MQEHFLKERGIAYRTNDFQAGRKTIVFVHGLSGSLSAWYPYEPLFENEFNIVTFDLRGHGLSTRRGEYAMEEFVEDLRALLHQLRIERCVLVSHSFGTIIAMEFGAAYPQKVEQMIYLAPAYGVHAFGVTRTLAAAGAALAAIPLRIRKYGRTDYSKFYPTGDYSAGRIWTDIANMGLRSYLRALRTTLIKNYNTDWIKSAGPTLVIHGTADRLVPVTHGRVLAKLLPRAQLMELAGANHILVLNNVEEVAAEVRKFVQHPTTSSG